MKCQEEMVLDQGAMEKVLEGVWGEVRARVEVEWVVRSQPGREVVAFARVAELLSLMLLASLAVKRFALNVEQ